MPLEPAIVATAIEAVLAAGALHRTHFGRQVRVEKKGAIDLVTEVDLAAEQCVKQLLASRFPSHALLAEESGETVLGLTRTGWCWVLDPLDGTTNFAHGLPQFAVSLGLEHEGEVVFGAVYDALRGELFTAERGQGAFLNGERLRVSATTQLIDALLCTGFPYDVHRRSEDLVALFAAFLGKAQAVRRLGSASLDLCYVAAGRFDGFWEAHLKPWDTCAGALIVQEAGGRVTTWDGHPYYARHESILATNGALHVSTLDLIRRFRRRPDQLRESEPI